MIYDHRWDLSPKEAAALQCKLSGKVVTEGNPAVSFVAGVDVHQVGETGILLAAACVLSFPSLELVEQKTARIKTDFPYVPGLLSFREGPAVLAVIRKLKITPDLVLFDGQGLAHPRRFGLASHMGLLLDVPSIGCAKSRLVGDCREPGPRKGDFSRLLDKNGEMIGAALRTRDNVRPLYVSIGHKISLDSAVRLTLACTTRYRNPEPLRFAHHIAKQK